MAKAKSSPFDVTLSAEQQTAVGQWLSWEVQNAIAVRSAQESEVEYWHALYEQARTRAKSLPWADAADLTSYIPCEQVDSIHARMMKTVWVDPLCTVTGYGTAADRAPFVEEFHQWKVEEEDLQSVLDKFFLAGLIEPRAMLEVSESSARRTSRKQISAKLQTTPEGGLIYGEDGNPLPMLDDQGQHVEAQDGEPSAAVVIDSNDVIRTGPAYRVLPYRDSLILPGHARDEDEIWGYAKRIFPRFLDLKAKAANGIYDPEAVQRIGDYGDREADPALQRANMEIAPQRDETAEKELWEVLWLIDLDEFLAAHNQQPTGRKEYKGARWYLATLHVLTGTLLRLKFDDFDQSRYVPMILFPRVDRATEGFSFIGHKLITVTEEHTAQRNMQADCMSKAVNSPILRMTGALWDPDEQPMGPLAVLDVRDPHEITPLQLPDVPQSVWLSQDRTERAAQRLGGINDIASGQQVQKGSPTLGEIQMATEQSFVRMDLIVRRAQKAIEKVYQIRHAIWKRAIAEQKQGLEPPETLVAGLESRGVQIDRYLPDGKITAALLDGPFRFKPYGSVETANLDVSQKNLVSMLQGLQQLLQMFGPTIGPMLMNPNAARAVFREFLRVTRWHNPQVFLGSPSQDLLGQGGAMAGQQVPMMGQGMPGQPPMPGMPGMPPGMPQMPPMMGPDGGGPAGPMGMPPGAPPMGQS